MSRDTGDVVGTTGISFHFTASGQLEATQQWGGGLLCFGVSQGWEGKWRGSGEAPFSLPPPAYVDFILWLAESLVFM